MTTSTKNLSATKTRSTRSRRISVGVVAALAMASVLLVSASPASAALAGTGGQPGSSSVGKAECRDTSSGRLTVSAPPPTIYARNFYAGAFNDAQRVRYRAVLWNLRTNQWVRDTGYTGLAWSWDNYPAQWSGETNFSGLDRGGVYKLFYAIEWYDNSGALQGFNFERHDSYEYINRWNTRLGGMSSCLSAG